MTFPIGEPTQIVPAASLLHWTKSRFTVRIHHCADEAERRMYLHLHCSAITKLSINQIDVSFRTIPV